jgi:hypothetical protein
MPLHSHSKRLEKIISTMRQRLEAKMGNLNNNAFKFRKLFQMYDKNKTGQVRGRAVRRLFFIKAEVMRAIHFQPNVTPSYLPPLTSPSLSGPVGPD